MSEVNFKSDADSISGDQSGELTLPFDFISKDDYGRFKLIGPLAAGGLGIVSVARDLELDREVALKEIHTNLRDSPDCRSRLAREALITGSLEHPGIVPIYGLGTCADGCPYYAMRLIRGESLRHAIQRFHNVATSIHNEVALQTLLGRFVDVCDTIDYAHSRGVIHRDIKPDNVMIGNYSETIVVDWGLAKIIGTSSAARPIASPASPAQSESQPDRTAYGRVFGTPAYMSGEQAKGFIGDVSTASDIYSLGATLYHILCGQAPYTGSDAHEIVARPPTLKLAKPRKINRRVPRQLEAICLKAMSSVPEERYKTAGELANDVRRWIAREPIIALREGCVIRALRRLGLVKRPFAAAAFAFLAIVDVSLLLAFAPLVLISGVDYRFLAVLFGMIGLAITIVLLQAGAVGGMCCGLSIAHLILWSRKRALSWAIVRWSAAVGAVAAIAPIAVYYAFFGSMLWTASGWAESPRSDPEQRMAEAYNNLAWKQATGSPQFRDGDEAIENAKRACALNTEDYRFLDTLAAAYSEVGDFEKAISCQERAIARLQSQIDTGAVSSSSPQRVLMEQALARYLIGKGRAGGE